MQSSVDRTTVLRGGLVGLAIGVALLAVSGFFLVVGPDQPSDILGVFIPLTAALVALGLGAMALIPLRCGDTLDRSPALIARTFRALGVLGVLMTAGGVTRGELPWIAFGLPPLVAALFLVKDSFRVSRHTPG